MPSPPDKPTHIIKLGGSLLDLPDLPERLAATNIFTSSENFALIVGGGQAADFVRHLDQQNNLTDEQAHWLAIAAMQFNTRIVKELIEHPATHPLSPRERAGERENRTHHQQPPNPQKHNNKLPTTTLAQTPTDLPKIWKQNHLALIDPYTWLHNLPADLTPPPARWSFTSDSIAAYIAKQLHANKLTLLKSVDPPKSLDLSEAAKQDMVDDDFPATAKPIPQIQIINLRDIS